MKLSIHPGEKAFVVASLILFSQGFYTVVLGTAIGGDEGDLDSALLRYSSLAVYIVTFALLGFRWPRTIAFLNTNKWLLVLLGLSVFSVSWSSVPSDSFRKAIALIGSSGFALYLASRFTFDEQLKMFGWSYGISLFCSFLFVFLIPTYGIMPNGSWRGIYSQKNVMGQSMFVSFYTFYFLSFYAKKYQLLFKICCLLSIVMIVFGQSVTSLMSVMFISATSQGLKLLSLKSKKAVLGILLFLILVALMLFLIIINFNTILNLYDRDITLTGRTPLWESLWGYIQQKPWLGYGYGSFFSGSHRETDIIWQVHNWVPPHAHNGFIQIWLYIGIIGLAIFSIGYFNCMFNSLLKYLVSKELKMLWIFLLLLYTIFFNLTEVSFINSGTLWILSLTAIYSINTVIKAKP